MAPTGLLQQVGAVCWWKRIFRLDPSVWSSNAVLGHARNDQCAMVLISLAHFMVLGYVSQIISLDRPAAPFAQQLLRKQGIPRVSIFVDTFGIYVCIESNAGAVNSTGNEMPCIALSRVSRTGQTLFGPFWLKLPT